jgi:kynurenine formamidase
MICVALLAATTSGPVQSQEPIRLDTLRTWMAAVSNRGRWGAEDELGTLNLISTGYRRSAAASVQEGLTVSLAHELRAGPNENAIRAMELDYTVAPLGAATATLDQVGLLYHGWAYSHVDALSHFAFDSTFYNGFGLEILTEEGAARLGVDAMGQGIVSRAVLIDVPRLRGVDYLRTDELVTAEDFEAWEARVGVRVSVGDVLLVRTGRWRREAELGPWSVRESSAGVHPSAALWLRERGVAALGGDGANDRRPSVVEGVGDPLHLLALVGMGMPLFDNLDLEDLADAAADRSRWSFLFVAAPVRVIGGSGAPVNPIAIF